MGTYPGGRRYYAFSAYLRARFGCRVYRVPVDAGFTCPNRDGRLGREGCVYCDVRGSGAQYLDRASSVGEQIRNGALFARRRYGAEKLLAYFQAFTNTYAPVTRLRQLYDEATAQEHVVGLAIGTRPDCVPDPVLDLVSGYTKDLEVWIEYGLQSAQDETLRRIGRGHDVRAFVDAVERTRGRGIRICTHVILGLPGECWDDMMGTAHLLAELAIDGVKIHPLHVLRGTRAEELYRRDELALLTQDEYVGLVCDFLERLPTHTVVQRLTGEGPRGSLIAPQWCSDKPGVLRAIDDDLARRGTEQGMKSGG